MEIKVLGSCCAGCKAFQQRVEEVVAEMAIDATIIKIDDIVEILNHKILSLPGFIINGKTISAGQALSKSEIKELIEREL